MRKADGLGPSYFHDFIPCHGIALEHAHRLSGSTPTDTGSTRERVKILKLRLTLRTRDIDTDVRGVQTTHNILADVAGVQERNPTGRQDSTNTGTNDAAATPHTRLLTLRMPA